MEKLYFSGANESKINFAGDYCTKYEQCAMVQIFCDEFEQIGKDNGMEFHYELHLCTNSFVRLCCHIRPYGENCNFKSKQAMLQKLKGKEHLIEKRAQLADKFKKAFADTDVEFIARRFNYLGLLKRDIAVSDFNVALAQAEQFIKYTFNTSLAIIKSVFCGSI